MIRFLTAGESHGRGEVAIVEGVPSGMELSPKDIQEELAKRKGGSGRGGRGAIETDEVQILSGVRFGKTIGSPIALFVENRDFSNWKGKMSKSKVTAPRPGHADLAGALKYGFRDVRNVLERASARETVMRVAVGAIAKVFLSNFKVIVASHTIQIGMAKVERGNFPFETIAQVFTIDPQTRCIDEVARKKMQEEILLATKRKDTLGGIIEIIAHNVPPGLGSFVHYDRKLDGRISAALMSIPSVKAVEIGEGISNAGKFGSLVHDEIFFEKEHFVRKTNRAGGIEGGVSNGEDIICRVYHKPISTLGNPLRTIDIETRKEVPAAIERSDICVVPRAGVISESMVAFILMESFLEKFGGDCLNETKRNFEGFKRQLVQ
ncbi:chorismate synthase [Candidatus Gottesmanbacteria bacterium]|nr:chorismate synthase [Candidatus Gottesmanbacteria bacterium]